MSKSENIGTSLGTRETQAAELALVEVLNPQDASPEQRVSYAELERHAQMQGIGSEKLHRLGWRVFEDMVRLNRGEIDVISVPTDLKKLVETLG